MAKTIFQKIADREIPAKIVHEDEQCLAIHDIQPQAPVHVLIFPKRLITRLNEAAPAEGTYTVLDKQNAQTFYDKDGSPIAPDDPRNPYGNLWIDLGQKLCIHGSPNPGDFSPAGCISLRGRDAGDLMGILSQGSSITVRR